MAHGDGAGDRFVDPDERGRWAIDLGVPLPKVTPPASRPGFVERTRLLARLDAEPAQVVQIIAPAGFGKSTVLTQWCERSPLPVAWVSLDELDNDPVYLVRAIALALQRVVDFDDALLRRLSRPLRTDAGPLRALAGLLAVAQAPFLLVLDNLEVLESPRSLDLVEAIIRHQPADSTLAMASRQEIPHSARGRAYGVICELGETDLAMNEQEARALLGATGIELDDEGLDLLLERTEGWPALLYLIAHGARESGVPAEYLGERLGEHPAVNDYLVSEIVTTLTPDERSFLLRTSVLDLLSGPLCDSVLDQSGSQGVLERLAAWNHLVVPVDPHGRWYRYHHLLAGVLRHQLAANDADEERELHLRASAWYEANGPIEDAVSHARLAGDQDRVVALVLAHGVTMYSVGRAATLRSWIEWCADPDGVVRRPGVAALGGILALLDGRVTAALRFAEAAESLPGTSRLPDGSLDVAWTLVMSAALCRHGVEQMRTDADLAVKELSPSSPLLPGALVFRGLGDALAGDDAAAEHHFALCAQVSLEVGEYSAASAALSGLAAIRIEHGDWQSARTCATQAVEVVDEAGQAGYLGSVFVFAVASRVATHGGDVGLARRFAARAQGLRPLCTFVFPASVLFLAHLARAHLELADSAAAASVLHQMRDILFERPDLGAMPHEVDAIAAAVASMSDRSALLSSLTTSELRIAPLLASHLSLREIADRTYLSRHTVKSHVMSIYRKAGVSSRSAAVERLRAAGILDYDLPGLP